jgi:pyruvate dehydrogenase E1 component beta subunit
MTVREALREAMAEEMRRDETVFLMGEEVASIRAPTRSARACSTSSAPSA